MEDKNLVIWDKYQDNVFMSLPFLDNVIMKTEGVYIIDVNGKRIMDFACGTFCSLLGHNHPKLIERLKKQLDVSIHTGSAYVSLPFFEAAEKLTQVLPEGLNKIVFFSTGSEANEAAIKIAKAYTGRCGILGFDHGHLGSTFLMNQVSCFAPGKSSSRPRISNVYKILTPSCHQCPVKAKYPGCDFMCLKISEIKLKFHMRSIAVMIAEPILSEAGVVMPPQGYFKRLKQVLGRYGILLIIDEAQTGFGRTGKWFAIEHHDIIPDILVASKTCGSGYPVSLVAVDSRLQDKLIQKRFSLNASHMNDPLGAVAVSAVIDIVKDEGMLEKTQARGKYLFEVLCSVKKDSTGFIRDVRGLGLMMGIELGEYGSERAEEIGLRLAYTLIEHGLNINWFFPSVLIFEPPLTVTDKDIDEAIGILRESIKEVLGDSMRNRGGFRKNALSERVEEIRSKKISPFRRIMQAITSL